jgi:hypothetical protein
MGKQSPATFFNLGDLIEGALEAQVLYSGVDRLDLIALAALTMDIAIHSMRLLFIITCPVLILIPFIITIMVGGDYPCM